MILVRELHACPVCAVSSSLMDTNSHKNPNLLEIERVLERQPHLRRLIRIGLEEDIRFGEESKTLGGREQPARNTEWSVGNTV